MLYILHADSGVALLSLSYDLYTALVAPCSLSWLHHYHPFKSDFLFYYISYLKLPTLLYRFDDFSVQIFPIIFWLWFLMNICCLLYLVEWCWVKQILISSNLPHFLFTLAGHRGYKAQKMCMWVCVLIKAFSFYNMLFVVIYVFLSYHIHFLFFILI